MKGISDTPNIMAFNEYGDRLEFETFSECSDYFNILPGKIREEIETGNLVETDKGSWFFDFVI